MPANLVRETSTTTGTGNFTLAGAATGCRTFNAAFGLNTSFQYRIDNGAESEIGEGYLSDSTTLVRATVKESTNSNNAVDFSAGTKKVFCVEPADTILPLGTYLAMRAGGITP